MEFKFKITYILANSLTMTDYQVFILCHTTHLILNPITITAEDSLNSSVRGPELPHFNIHFTSSSDHHLYHHIVSTCRCSGLCLSD